jgi:hypothetical protein
MCTCVIVVCTYAPLHLLPSRVTSQPIGSASMGYALICSNPLFGLHDRAGLSSMVFLVNWET